MSFRTTVEKLAEQAGGGERMPCRWCGTATLLATLSHYGRCHPCYEAYCQEVQPVMRGGPKGHGIAPIAKRDEIDEQARLRAKAETARRVAQYARDKGIELEPPTGDQSRARFSGAVR